MMNGPTMHTYTPSAAESSVSDDTLVRWLRSGNDAAAARLYSRYVDRLRALARAKLSADLSRRVDAEDIVQSVFRRFFQAARQGNYDAPAGEDLWDLLLVITLNKIRSEKSFQRAAKRDVRRTAEGGRDGVSLEQIAIRNDVAAAMLRLHVEEALARFPADYRTVVELRMEGYEVRDIAQRTGRAKRTVERILQESRVVLRDSLKETD
jgi:RNA polymerase sigma-70 factor (ECF subfamily)